MNLSDEKKVDILTSLLSLRYDRYTKMHERSTQFAIWILGLGIALSWLLAAELSLSIIQKILFTIFLSFIAILTIKFLRAIENGFNKNKKIMIDIEDALKLYEPDMFLTGNSIYPEKYKEASKFNKNSHFTSIYIWIYVIFIFLVLLMWSTEIVKFLEFVYVKIKLIIGG